MKKSGFVVGLIGAAFGLAVYNKMQKMTVNKDSVKGKAKEAAGNVVGNEKMQAEGTLDQVVGASKEVLMDLKNSVSSAIGVGTPDKVAGKAKEAAGDITDDPTKKVEGFVDQAAGHSKEIIADLKDKSESMAQDVKDKFDQK
ncbi:CsbD family protein [Enterococcus sp. FDAARGOS_553]|uniref:CsbD family protein n=1 Tax=Enterococcus TaxID=1350 RepID=UPI000F5035D7|nr:MULTISPECIES: CsbD family protein [Enterococcus]AYY10657.1 CsbD family protein [Enterococcus sp. FDAARGOS_553]MCD4986683.1 CsbD family protein [Enterococcus gallinarum]MDV7785106.1 CsbD family protein [Enterococcus gallinarum]UQR02151.1 CsbD family protein [Enterococcus gallinarum]